MAFSNFINTKNKQHYARSGCLRNPSLLLRIAAFFNVLFLYAFCVARDDASLSLIIVMCPSLSLIIIKLESSFGENYTLFITKFYWSKSSYYILKKILKVLQSLVNTRGVHTERKKQINLKLWNYTVKLEMKRQIKRV